MKKTFRTLLFMALSIAALSSCEDVPAPYELPTAGGGGSSTTEEIQAVGDGTLANPYNVKALKEFIDAGEYSGQMVYFKGIVTSFKSGEEPGNSYGNATFYIADQAGGSNTFYCYRIKDFNNEKFSTDDADLFAVGDTVVIYGQVTLYSGTTYETEQNTAYLISINGQGESESGTTTDPEEPTTDPEETGDGTAANPYNVAAANAVCAALQKSSTSATYLSDEVYVEGIISKIESIDTGSYGNATYYISADGTTTNQLEVYRGYSLNGNKFTSESEIAVGQTVVVCGQLQNWLGTYEFTKGSKIISIE